MLVIKGQEANRCRYRPRRELWTHEDLGVTGRRQVRVRVTVRDSSEMFKIRDGSRV